ncbi:hypothetical protein [Streptomyces palmae]|uniref:Uncharacterized protein n=1 Tax=Streptomyces palmae TaxID=1701085 RepID=A0A4Z0GLL2_9ACTN|nr:hypothetical protein [Streptomyces palmae]TGA97314.1 hypothetical protein E4099_23625 [Streptomyces palmae]
MTGRTAPPSAWPTTLGAPVRHRAAAEELSRCADRLRATGRDAQARLAEEYSARALFAPDDTARALRDRLTRQLAPPGQAAAAGRHGSLRYVRRPGEVRVDGSRAWRTCNPGLLPSGPFTRDYGALADEDGIAVFPDEDTGRRALAAFLGTEDAQHARVSEVLQAVREREQPPPEPDGAFDTLAASVRLDPRARLSELPAEALADLADALAAWAFRRRAGHRHLTGEDSAPAWARELLGRSAGPGRTPGHRIPLAARPAERYRSRADICILTTHFNPCGYRSRRRNILSFLRSLDRSGAAWRCVECAFGDRPFELPAGEQILQVRSDSVLWQKERLLNLLARTLPDRFSKLAWIDGDVFFSESDWLARTSDLLTRYTVVQPFTEAIRLAAGQTDYHLRGEVVLSFAHRFHLHPDPPAWPAYPDHGHTGYAWAGRREWIEEHGLYDAGLSGTGDHLMAHAFVGDWDNTCAGLHGSLLGRHYETWARTAYPHIRSALGRLDGAVLSLWHGRQQDRNYHQATVRLRELSFDPDRDLRLGPTGCWEWARPRAELERWAHEYFRTRREDSPP